MIDPTKLILISTLPAFKAENNVISGSVNITGTTAEGVNTREWIVPINVDADYYDVQFNGKTGDDSSFGGYAQEQLRKTGWFRSGDAVWSISNGVISGYPLAWIIFGKIEGSNLVIRAEYEQQFVGTQTVTSEPVYYRIVPYSSTV